MAQVYQAADGQWIVYNNGIKRYFATQMEAEIMDRKLKFATEVQDFSREFSLMVERAPAFKDIWDDREYLAGADNKAIIDADVESLGITAAQLASFISFTPQLLNLMGNLAVTTGDYSATLNKLRDDM